MRAALVVVAITVTVVLEPVVVAAGVAWVRAGRLAPSVFVAWEEMRAATFRPFENPVLDANIIYISFVKGALDGQLYLYTVRALLLSLLLGLLLGLNVVAWHRARSFDRAACPARLSRWGGTVGGWGGGLGVVLGAVAGAAGCCGLSVGGGGLLLALGFSYTTATAFGAQSTLVQLVACAVLAMSLWHRCRHLPSLTPRA